MSLLVLGVPLPAPIPDPLLPRLMGLMRAAPAMLQTVVTGGGTAGGGAAAGGAGTAVVVPGTVVATAPAVMTVAPAMMAIMPGIALGILKALFIGIYHIFINIPDLQCILFFSAQITESLKKPEKKTPSYHHTPTYGHQQPSYDQYEQPSYGHDQYEQPSYSHDQYQQPSTSYGQEQYQEPSYGHNQYHG